MMIFNYCDKQFFYLLLHMYIWICRIRIINGILWVIREDWLLSFTYVDKKCKWVFFFLSFFLSSLHQQHNHHLSILSSYMCMCMCVSYSINISRRTSARVKVSIYIYIYTHTVEGVCSRLIVDYHRGTCEWIVGFMLLFVIVIKEEKRKKRKKKLICKRITRTSQTHF